MRILLSIILVMITMTSISQNMDVHYTGYFDTDQPKIIPAQLQIRNQVSVFELQYDNRLDWYKERNEKKEEHSRKLVSKQKSSKELIINDFIKRDFSNRTLQLIEEVIPKTHLIHDNFIEIQWTILPEKKMISNYNCQKAEATFRGLKWIAWFAPDLTTNAGPWKLYGLPGLILEAYDENEKYRFVAEKIILNNTSSSYFPSENLPEITIKKAIENEDKRKEAFHSSLTRGEFNTQKSTARRNTMEPLYEWEE